LSLPKNPNQTAIPGVKFVSGEIENVLKELEDLGYTKALLGGGTFLNSLFLEKNLISEIMLTVEPKIFGQGLSLFNISKEADLKLLECKKLNENTVLLHYQFKKDQ
jgi:dihydrofolate reductase